jgi:hypothetical protein
MPGARVHFRFGDHVHFSFGQFARSEHLPRAAAETVITGADPQQ